MSPPIRRGKGRRKMGPDDEFPFIVTVAEEHYYYTMIDRVVHRT
jgi:hypothetical protein